MAPLTDAASTHCACGSGSAPAMDLQGLRVGAGGEQAVSKGGPGHDGMRAQCWVCMLGKQ